jgi:S-DNA-T family DNA segregation ATPase FtsK/SpoIIIE
MARFNGLPHLFGKVETKLERMLAVLRWTVVEMDRRYKLMEKAHARDIDTYNGKVRKAKSGEMLPRIVTLIDELADLMMVSGEHTEASLVRLAQMGRATGIHLVLATQRPSTDVVTGLIKANFPARISFAVASSIDSRVILDTQGAESLLGRGDMLYLPPEGGGPLRVQGVMISDREVDRVLDYWRTGWQAAEEEEVPWENISIEDEDEEEDEALIEQATEIVRQTGRASASMLQRRLHIGYPRAARLIDQLEDLGVVGPSMGPGKEREVLYEDQAEDE